VPSFCAPTTQTPSIGATDTSRMPGNDKVREFCFIPIEWCVHGTRQSSPLSRVTKSVLDPREGQIRHTRLDGDARDVPAQRQPSHHLPRSVTPKHVSWINQVEIWFSVLVRKLLRRSNFTSKAHLKQRIEAFIAYLTRPWPSHSAAP
jgi:hypothetical protein